MSAPALELRGVGVRYGSIIALGEVSLAVKPGQICALIGPNGSGKTTLLNSISGFVPLHNGIIELDGRRIDRLPPYGRARLDMSRTFQHARVEDDLTVGLNAISGLRWTSRPRAVAAQVLGLPSARARMNSERGRIAELLKRAGLEAESGTRVAQLSFGTRKLTDLVRAIAAAPGLLLMDEPTAGLSDGEVDRLTEVLQRECVDMTVVVVAHHMGFVSNVADRVVCLQDGAVIADGHPRTVQADPSVIAAYVGPS